MKRKAILATLAAAICSPFLSHAQVYMERENFKLRSISGPRSEQGVARGVYGDTGISWRDPATHPFGKALTYPDYIMWHTDESDFDAYVAADWTVTNTGAATQALAAGDGGLLLFTNSAAGADIAQIERKVAAFRTVGKVASAPGVPQYFGCKLKVDSAANGDFLVGLVKPTANAFTTGITDGIWFQKIAGAAIDFKIVSSGAGTTTVAGIANAADNTFISLEWCYDGNVIWYGVNGAILGSVADTNVPAAVDTGPAFALRNNTAVARTLTLDHFSAGKYRG
jgi:hypothetical protein